VVALDGPSGAGKSTVARGVALRLDLDYLDTGAMYRAVTWRALAGGVDVVDVLALEDLTARLALEISTDPRQAYVRVDGRDITKEIRGIEVTNSVSAVSAAPGVRRLLVARQQELIELTTRGIVVEGRDIGTVVAPDAPVKVFLTASLDARARRRADESAADLGGADVPRTTDSLRRRDALDSSRAVDPLRAAPDAWEVDSTHLAPDEVIELIVGRCAKAGLTVPA
jgi:cytidylate kinase